MRRIPITLIACLVLAIAFYAAPLIAQADHGWADEWKRRSNDHRYNAERAAKAALEKDMEFFDSDVAEAVNRLLRQGVPGTRAELTAMAKRLLREKRGESQMTPFYDMIGEHGIDAAAKAWVEDVIAKAHRYSRNGELDLDKKRLFYQDYECVNNSDTQSLVRNACLLASESHQKAEYLRGFTAKAPDVLPPRTEHPTRAEQPTAMAPHTSATIGTQATPATPPALSAPLVGQEAAAETPSDPLVWILLGVAATAAIGTLLIVVVSKKGKASPPVNYRARTHPPRPQGGLPPPPPPGPRLPQKRPPRQ